METVSPKQDLEGIHMKFLNNEPIELQPHVGGIQELQPPKVVKNVTQNVTEFDFIDASNSTNAVHISFLLPLMLLIYHSLRTKLL